MSTPSTVGVDDDFTSSDTCVSLWSANDESAGGLDVVDGAFIKESFGDDGFDDMFHDLCSEVFGCDFLGVLGGDDDGVYSQGDEMTRGILTVFNSDLCFSRLADLTERGILESGRSQAIEPSRRRRAISLFRLCAKRIVIGNSSGVSSVAYPNIIPYQSTRRAPISIYLIPSAEIFKSSLDVDTICDFRGLLLDSDEDITCLVIESLVAAIISDLLNGLTDNLLIVQRGLGRDFTENHNHTRLGRSFTRNLGKGIFCETGIELDG